MVVGGWWWMGARDRVRIGECWLGSAGGWVVGAVGWVVGVVVSFLAATSSSRSDDVTLSACLSVTLFFF